MQVTAGPRTEVNLGVGLKIIRGGESIGSKIDYFDPTRGWRRGRYATRSVAASSATFPNAARWLCGQATRL